MIYFIIAILAMFALLLGTWLHYLAIMSLQSADEEGRLNKWSHRFGMIILLIGYLLDFLSNVIPLTILMLEVPKEFLVSARVTRHKFSSANWQERRGLFKYLTKWRYLVSTWACTNLLDPFDPSGCHCKE